MNEEPGETMGNPATKQSPPMQEPKAPEDRMRRNQGAIDLVQGWLQDESGYDEETWPNLQTALNAHRREVGARLLFDDG